MKPIKVPQLAESIMEATIYKWLIKEGAFVKKGEPLVELETDKVNVEVHSPFTGKLLKIIAENETDVQIGETIATLDDSKTDEQTKKENALKEESTVSVEKTKRYETEEVQNESEFAQQEATKVENDIRLVRATPSARKYARAKGMDINDIGLNAPDFIRKTHIEKALGESDANEQEQTEQEEMIKLSRRRRTIAERLVNVQQKTAMLTTFNEVDMTRVLELRKIHQSQFQNKHGIKLGLMSFFTKATVAALKKFPHLNSELNNDHLIVKKHYDIGIAVASPNGLVVPVIRDVNNRTFSQIEKEVKRLQDKVLNEQLEIEDLSGGTFTITNGGVFGSLFSTPILNAPQVGILGMHTIQKRPVATENDEIVIKPMMYIALSYDHQVVDGKEAVQFLTKVKQMIESPEALLFDL